MYTNLHQNIVSIIKEKSSIKQDVFVETANAFRMLKDLAKYQIESLKHDVFAIDKRVIVEYNDRSEFMFEIKIGGDSLVFQMHTNIFDFDDSHYIRKSPYISKDTTLSYCGLVSVYNFLADSFKYYRLNDVGYLMARVFVNKESHYFVESKNRKITLGHDDFGSEKLITEKALNLLQLIILSSIEFDLYTPPFETQREITVSEINNATNMISIQTGKRLGFKFQFEDDKEIK